MWGMGVEGELQFCVIDGEGQAKYSVGNKILPGTTTRDIIHILDARLSVGFLGLSSAEQFFKSSFFSPKTLEKQHLSQGEKKLSCRLSELGYSFFFFDHKTI